MSQSSAPQHVIVGTAGHIDHGKTRLVGRLSGIATDRLPEEKARGISIDLGFAHWEHGGYQFGVVDVPGHERFVKNMVAGATGVNLAVLVVAADDGVMPQTREHLEIMDLLGVRAGVVAITKIDLVEPDFVELVEAEVEELVDGTFLEGCTMVPVSSETGDGVEQLRTAITGLARETVFSSERRPFRLPIDRVFTLAGHGTVVTGSVMSGEVHPGDTVELLPERRELRVRGVQNHNAAAADAGARQRTAVNLAGIKTDEVDRGNELATAGFLAPSHRMLVEIRSLSSSSVVLKDRMELSLHLGTNEAVARVILKGRVLKPGERSAAELRLQQPVCAEWGQRFILRRVSPAVTVAGGVVLDPCLPQKKRLKHPQEYAAEMSRESAGERLSNLLARMDGVAGPLEAARRAGVLLDEYEALLAQLRNAGEIVELRSGERPFPVHTRRLQTVAQSVLRTVRETIAAAQPRRSLPQPLLQSACRAIAEPPLLAAVFDDLLKRSQLVRVGRNVGPADAQVKLTKKQQAALSRAIQAVETAGLSPPTIKELAAEAGVSVDELAPLLNLAVEDGVLIAVSDALHFSPAALDAARIKCRDHFAAEGPATMSQLREVLGISRKFSVPLCEFLDEAKITRRDGDVRTAGAQIDEPFA